MKKAQVLWLIFGVIALLFLIGAATVQPGRPISQYPRVTVLQGTDIFPIARTNVTPATNMGVTGFVISNYVVSIATGAVDIVAGTNVTITSTTNSTGGQTHTIAVTNTFASSADVVWTNNAGIIHPNVLNGQQTNSIQIWTNGGLTLGVNTIADYGPAQFGETIISGRNVDNGEIDYNEIYLFVKDGTNLNFQDLFMNESLNRRRLITTEAGNQVEIDEFATEDGEFVYRALDTNTGYSWLFDPLRFTGSTMRYLFNTTSTVETNEGIMVWRNNGTNKMILDGEGYLGLGTNDPRFMIHLVGYDITRPVLRLAYASGAGNTKALEILNGSGATNFDVGVDGLVRSATINNSGTITGATVTTTALNVTGGTLGAGKVLTDTGGTGAATWETGTSLAAVTNIVTNFVQSVIGTYMNLSVQAAKLPTTNYPMIDAGWQFWELVYPRTNSVGFTNSLEATWQFVTPTNYFTNNMKVFGQAILLSTNGPTASNVVWRASIFRATPGDATDVHVGSFGATVTATQTWSASATGTNKVQSFLIDLSTNSLLQANDFGALKLERVNSAAETNDLKSSVSLIGLQLRY